MLQPRTLKRKNKESRELSRVVQVATPAEIETGTLLKQWLIDHDPPLEVLESKWRQSVKSRNEDIKKSKDVKDIVSQWPKYTGAFGHLLVNFMNIIYFIWFKIYFKFSVFFFLVRLT
jgi:hypothetical protein